MDKLRHLSSSNEGDINNTEDEFYDDKRRKDIEKCGEICKDFYYCDSKNGKCTHKGIFPLYLSELLQIFIFIFSSSIATACGIGGGFIYSSVLMYVEEFVPTEAFPIAMFLIFICSIITYINGVVHKIKNPESDFVNLDFAIVFIPSMLLGTKFGTILNRILSSLILTIIIILVLFKSFKQTYKSALENHRKEKLEEKKGYTKMNDFKESSNNDDILQKKNSNYQSNENVKRKTSKNSKESVMGQIEEEININSSLITKDIHNEENNPLRYDRLKYVVYFLIISIADQIIEGNNKIPSIIGIKKCSGAYWLVFSAYIGTTIFCCIRMFELLKINYDYKKCLISFYKDDKLEYLEKNKIKIAIMGLIAGIISGMIGVGGGMISNPLLLSMGFSPKITTSTSNFIIVISSFIGFMIFLFAGQINLQFAIFLGLPCGISAYYGSIYIQNYIKKNKKSAFLLFILLGIMFLSFTMLIASNIKKVSSDLKAGNTLIGVNSFC